MSYDSVTGILVQLEWVEINFMKIISLEEMTFSAPRKPIKNEGVLLTGIFIELAVTVWLLANRFKKA